jgi:hypothetical protein
LTIYCSLIQVFQAQLTENQDSNIDIEAVFRTVDDPAGDGGEVPAKKTPRSEYLDKATKLGGLSLGAALSIQQALQGSTSLSLSECTPENLLVERDV